MQTTFLDRYRTASRQALRRQPTEVFFHCLQTSYVVILIVCTPTKAEKTKCFSEGVTRRLYTLCTVRIRTKWHWLNLVGLLGIETVPLQPRIFSNLAKYSIVGRDCSNMFSRLQIQGFQKSDGAAFSTWGVLFDDGYPGLGVV